MSRLTKWVNGEVWYYTKEDYYPAREMDGYDALITMTKLAHYEDLEEQGLLTVIDNETFQRDNLDRCTHRHCNKCDKYRRDLQRYKSLEEQGRLIELPCAVGDTVYEVQEIRKRIQEYTVISVHYSHCSILFGWELKDGKGIYSNLNGFEESAIGKTIFLTPEAAEAKLAEMEGAE